MIGIDINRDWKREFPIAISKILSTATIVRVVVVHSAALLICLSLNYYNLLAPLFRKKIFPSE